MVQSVFNKIIIITLVILFYLRQFCRIKAVPEHTKKDNPYYTVQASQVHNPLGNCPIVHELIKLKNATTLDNYVRPANGRKSP